MADLTRNFFLWKSFFLNCFTRDMEYKANLLSSLVLDGVYYGTHFFFFNIIFAYVDSLMEFTKNDVMIFLIITFLMDTMYMFFFSGNLFNINRLIVKGDLDFVLLKPVNSQFFASFRYVRSYTFLSVFLIIGLLIFISFSSPGEIATINILGFCLSFIIGISIWYSIDLSIGCLGFWFKNFSTGGWLSHEILKFSMRPDTIYTGWLRRTLFTIVPMALISSVPARILLFGFDWKLLMGQFAVAGIFLVITKIVWQQGLKRYESASS